MSRKQRIRKSPDRQLSDLEDHLRSLQEAMALIPQDPSRFKQLASELRILACDHAPDKRLLITLMKELAFDRPVQPPGPPLENFPIAMVGWRIDPVMKRLTEKLQAAGGDQKILDDIRAEQISLRRSMPLSEYVDKALAVTIEGRDYSYGQLVRDVGQQLGGSHEDRSVDIELVAMEQTIIGHRSGHIAVLLNFANLVFEIGLEVLAHAAKSLGAKLRYFAFDGNVVRVPAVEAERFMPVPSGPATTPARVGADLQRRGTIAMMLHHDHHDWTTNSHAYNFGVFQGKGVTLSISKDPAAVLWLRLDMDSGRSGSINYRLIVTAPVAQVAVSWAEGTAHFYVDGALAGSVELTTAPTSQDAV